MVSNQKTNESAILEKYRVAFENVSLQPEIAALMGELGYTTEKIAEGKGLLRTARSAYDLNKREDDETLDVKKQLESSKAVLTAMYRMHRKKAKVLFRNDPVKMSQLGLEGSMPEAYLPWIETIRKFYINVLADTAIKESLLRLKITEENLNEGATLISKIEQERAAWLRELGESQDATQTKDKALAAISIWMRDFYDVAKIALDDSPQLLEVLGLSVKN